MAVIATGTCTLAVAVDVQQVDTWYCQTESTASAPSKPATASPSGWQTAEYDFDSSKAIWSCQKTTLTDGTFYWGAVSKASAYEGAVVSWNLANAAQEAAEAISNAGLTRNFYPSPVYEPTSDAAIVDGKTYYTRSENAEGGYDYAPVQSPDASGIATYYEASPGVPEPPYGVGDTWTPGDGLLMVCVASRESGETYSADDWDYADGTADALTQLELGISAARTELESAIDDTEDRLNQNVSAVSSNLNERMDSLEGDISSASEWHNYLHFDQSTGLSIGQVDGDYSQVMDATGTHWKYDGHDAASVQVDADGKGAIMLARSEVTEQMRVGNYVWFNRGSRMSLRYIPEEV